MFEHMRARVLLPFVFALVSTPALAQDSEGTFASEPSPVMSDSDAEGARDATGAPRSLEPPEPVAEAPSASPDLNADSDETVIHAAPSVMGHGAPGAVEVGSLGNVEGPVAGTLNDTNGGLGAGTWSGVSRANAIAALTALPPPASPSVRGLVHKLLMTAAAPPAGRAEGSFNAVRIRTLLNAGMVTDAASIAAQVRAPKDPDTSRVQADALLLAGDDTNACGDATAFRMESDDPFWIELRAYCYALAKDPALDLTRAVLGTSDAAFNALLDGLVSGKMRATVALAKPTALHIRLIQKLNLPLNAGVLELGTAGAVVALESPKTPKDVRIAAADRALRAGAASPGALGAVLDMITFKPDELVAATAMARNDGLIVGLARLRAALKREPAPVKRAELIYTALRMAEEQHLLFQIAPVFVPDALALTPAHDWANWGVTFTRAFIETGRYEAADRWLAVVQASPISPDELVIDLALGTRDPVHVQAAQPALANLAQRALADPDGSGARAALVFGMFDAMGVALPPEADARVEPLLTQRWPGRRPSDAAMRKIADAALHNRRGEVVLGAISVIGRGPGDLAPAVTVRLVRALQTAGVHDGAHVLAVEAVLSR